MSATDEVELLTRLRAGDEDAFAAVVRRHHTGMLHLALGYVPSRAVAEEVVQDAWLGVLRGIDKFEGRASLKTWLYRIVVNRARSAGVREVREVSLDPTGSADAAERFTADGAWSDPPVPWTDQVEDRLTAAALQGVIRTCLEGLPVNQREVVTLRDLDGLSSSDTCEVLGISEANQRVLLHRGRARLRAQLDAAMRES